MSTERRYDPKTVEPKWQAIWEDERTWEVSNDDVAGSDNYYVAEMLPYPSGKLHMGHVRNYTINDVMYRHLRMKGYNVLMRMGWDAFGLPAEQYAVQTGTHPRASTEANMEYVRKNKITKQRSTRDRKIKNNIRLKEEITKKVS